MVNGLAGLNYTGKRMLAAWNQGGNQLRDSKMYGLSPSGVAADAFYQKGCGFRTLLRIIGGLARPKRLLANQQTSEAPLRIQRNGNDASGGTLIFPSRARIACAPSSRLSVVLSARYQKRIASIAGTPFTTQSLSRSTGPLDRRLKDVVARQSQPGPVALQRNKKAILMRNIAELNVLLRTRVELKARPKPETAESRVSRKFFTGDASKIEKKIRTAGGISSRFLHLARDQAMG